MVKLELVPEEAQSERTALRGIHDGSPLPRATDVEGLVRELRQREDDLRRSEEARAALEQELRSLQAKADGSAWLLALRGLLAREGQLPGADALLTVLSMHATDRLFRRWRRIRSLEVSEIAPTIGERFTVYVARSLPAALSGLEAAEVERAVARASGAVKRVARAFVPAVLVSRALLRRRRG